MEFPLDDPRAARARVAVTGLPSWSTTSRRPTEPIDLPSVRALGLRSVVMVPLRVRAGVRRPLGRIERAGAGRPARHGAALRRRQPRRPRGGPGRELPDHRGAVPGLEDKVRVRTEQLRSRERGAAGGLSRSTSDPDAAHPAREDGVDGPARGRGRPRAQQPHRLRLLQRHDARGLRQAAPRHAGGLPGPPAAPGDPRSASRPSGSAARSTTRSGTSTP